MTKKPKFLAGDLVKHLPTKKTLTILEGPNNKGYYRASLGNMMIWVNPKELKIQTLSKKQKFNRPISSQRFNTKHKTPQKLDLHGLKVSEAIEKVEIAIDQAILTNAEKLEIIHGIGSGAIKNALHSYLSTSKQVANFHQDQTNPGVTWVWI